MTITGDELKAIAMRHAKTIDYSDAPGYSYEVYNWSAIAAELNERTEPAQTREEVVKMLNECIQYFFNFEREREFSRKAEFIYEALVAKGALRK